LEGIFILNMNTKFIALALLGVVQGQYSDKFPLYTDLDSIDADEKIAQNHRMNGYSCIRTGNVWYFPQLKGAGQTLAASNPCQTFWDNQYFGLTQIASYGTSYYPRDTPLTDEVFDTPYEFGADHYFSPR
jgi:hypothetical protein